jgi:hypothetical protein
MPEIVIDFFPNGTAKIETFGYTGSSCKEATDFLQSLGPVTDEELKPEYFEDAEEHLYAR